MQHVVPEELCRQRVDQRLQLRSALADPLGQGRLNWSPKSGRHEVCYF